MTGVWWLSIKHLWHHRVRTAILIACIALAMYVPVTIQSLMTRYRTDLEGRAAGTPLIAGAKGNRFDLTLGSLYFRANDLDPIPYSEYEAIQASGRGLAIPLNLRFTARGYPIAAVTPEYYDVRGLEPVSGTIPLRLGDVVLGAKAAEALGLGPRDSLFSDQRELYDISKPPALKMRVTGVLKQSRGPDDMAVFVDVKTAWILEGLAHGHDDVKEGVPDNLVLQRTQDNVAVSQAMIEYNEVTPDNLDSFHFHGDTSALPLSSVLVFPPDDRAGTLIKAKINTSKTYQMVVPREVIADLMSFVFRIKSVFDTFSLVLGISTGLMTLLVILLTMRARAAEMEALNRIGCSRFTVAKLYATEIGIILVISLALAAAGVGVTLVALPDLVRTL